MNFWSYKKCRAFAKKLKLTSGNQWQELSYKHKFPKEIPRATKEYFTKTGEWKGWKDFLGLDPNFDWREKSFPSFQKAKKILKKYNIQNEIEYSKIAKKLNLPANPATYYKDQYKNFYDFVGKKQFISFTKAKKIIKNKVFSRHEYYEFVRKNKKKYNFPVSAREVYKNNWKGWGDFLGTGYIACSERRSGYYWSFGIAQKFVQKLNLHSQKEYHNWLKKNKHKRLPSSCNSVYKNNWKGWADFLGYKSNYRFTQRNKKRLSYKQAKKWARKECKKLSITTESAYLKKVRTDKDWLPQNMPIEPSSYYKRHDKWVSWNDFLGTKPSRHLKRQFRPYEDTKKWIQRQKIKTFTAYQQAKKPYDIPSNPKKTYKKDWRSYKDFLGKPELLPFKQARELARSFQVKSLKEYQKLWNKGKIPKSLPYSFKIYEKEKDWEDYADFLGCKPHKIQYLSFKQAKNVVQKLKIKNQKHYQKAKHTGKIPITIPYSPNVVYRRKL